MINEATAKVKSIAAAVKAATVAIVLYHPDIPEQNNRPFSILGSGFCIHPEGVIVTSKHVMDGFIDPHNRPAHVMIYHPEIPGIPGLYVHVVTVLGYVFHTKSANSEEVFDLAVLRITLPSEGYKGGYPVIPIACYEDLHEMMDVATCGFPLGDYLANKFGTLTSSFSKGIISSIIPWPGVTQDKLSGFQLDLKVTEGNSGGPVFSLTSGQVFGVLRRGIEEHGIQLVARAEPIYPIVASGLVEQLLQAVPPATSPEVA